MQTADSVVRRVGMGREVVLLQWLPHLKDEGKVGGRRENEEGRQR